jgi:pyruvate formate lyase activating enzyme
MADKDPTSAEALTKAMEIGKSAGLRYIYVGNLPGSKAESTYCYSCGDLLIERCGYMIGKNNVTEGCCPKCQTKIAGFDL